MQGLAKLPSGQGAPLQKLARLRGNELRTPPMKSASEIELKDLPFAQRYPVYPPFNSSYEVYIWEWLNKTGKQSVHQWQTQITFGGKRQRGSTRVDFLSYVLMIAWYPDGAHWHVGNVKEGQDVILRAQVAARGFRVVQWILESDRQLVSELPKFYSDMVYRGRNK